MAGAAKREMSPIRRFSGTVTERDIISVTFFYIIGAYVCKIVFLKLNQIFGDQETILALLGLHICKSLLRFVIQFNDK